MTPPATSPLPLHRAITWQAPNRRPGLQAGPHVQGEPQPAHHLHPRLSLPHNLPRTITGHKLRPWPWSVCLCRRPERQAGPHAQGEPQPAHHLHPELQHQHPVAVAVGAGAGSNPNPHPCL